MVWIDQQGRIKPRKVALGVVAHTEYEVLLYFDWFEYLRKVADRTGISIADAKTAFTQAQSLWQSGDFNSAYTKAVSAVTLARNVLKASKTILNQYITQFKTRIATSLQTAQSRGVNITGFAKPLAIATAIYNAGDYTAAFDVHDSLAGDVERYVSSAIAGKTVGKMSATYDIPAGTTDIITTNFVSAECAGWSQEWLSSNIVRNNLVNTVKSVDPTAVILGYVVMPPRIVIFVRSPIAPIIIGIILAAVFFAICVSAIALWAWSGAAVEIKKADEEKAALDATLAYKNSILAMYANGQISEATMKDLLAGADSNLNNTLHSLEQLGGVNIMGLIMMLIPIGVALLALSWFLKR